MSTHDPALCDLPVCSLCEAHGLGYTRGKEKAYADVRAVLDGLDHAAGCGCEPCRLIRDVMAAARAAPAGAPMLPDFQPHLDSDSHFEDCQGPGCGASCRCACHAWELG